MKHRPGPHAERFPDAQVARAGVDVSNRRNWDAAKAVSDDDIRLAHKEIVGKPTQGRQGMGLIQIANGTMRVKRESISSSKKR